MIKKTKHKGKVERGKLILFDRPLFNQYVSEFEGKNVDILVQLPTKQNTDPQRKYLFGVAYKIISEETGMTVEEVHYCEPIMRLRMDYTKQFPTPQSVSRLGMTTVEFNEYKDKLQQFAAEQGWFIPDPDEI